MGKKRYGIHSVELSNTGKTLFPGAGITKGDYIEYCEKIAGVMLPHLADRPLTLHRFPDGIDKDGFYQQQRSDYFPDWIETCSTPRAEKDDMREAVEHVVCNNEATLVYLANQAAITLHGWLSRTDNIRKPDRLVFDLDPSTNDFGAVRHAARQVVKLMKELGMNPHAMTTGSRGLHVIAPLRADSGFDAVRELAIDMAACLAAQHEDTLTVEQRKNRRKGRIYLDVMRNVYGQTTVVPYSVRANTDAAVATPITLSELDDSDLDPRGWNMRNIFRRLGHKKDPWRNIRRHATNLASAREALTHSRNRCS
jgi:bifunctional non-homologous end joining protein LigD